MSTCTSNDESQSVSSTIECDIGKLKDLRVDLNRLSWEDKYRVLETDPDSDASSYPHTRPCESSSYRQFQPSWLKHHSWLHYSRFLDGAYCRVCVFFAPNQVVGQGLGQFVSKPFISWIKNSSIWSSHSDDQNGGVLGTIRESLSSNLHSFGRGETDDGKQSKGDQVITEDCDVV